jgi:hypothetical protein
MYVPAVPVIAVRDRSLCPQAVCRVAAALEVLPER